MIMEGLVQKMHTVWISCPLCSVSIKHSVPKDDDYQEIDLCSRCKSLCEKCETNQSLVDSNLCHKCTMYSKNKNTDYFGELSIDTNPTAFLVESSNIQDTEEIIEDNEVILNSNFLKENESNLIQIDYQKCQLIDKHCIKHPVDSVDAPINRNIGNKSVEIIVEGLKDFVDANTVILDLGSGSGKTITKLATLLNTTAVGIECDKLRHECSMVNLSSILKHIDDSVTFIQGDIEMYFNSFNGYSIIYMFDTAYPTSTIQKIMDLFNNSSSIKAIVCNSKLDQIGFNVTLSKSLGSLSAGNTSRNFYIYQSNLVSENFTLDDQNDKDIQIARSTRRIELANTTSKSFLSKSRNDKLNEQKKSKEVYLLLQKSPTTINGIKFAKVDQVVGSTDKQSCYIVYNRQDLSITNKFEYGAIIWNSKYLGVITPCYDGNEEILVRIIHYVVGPVYEAIIYNIRSDLFRKLSVRSLFSNLQFNHEIPFPDEINMIEVMSKYRKQYPIHESSDEADVEVLSASRKRKINQPFSPNVTIVKRVNASTTATKSKSELTELQNKVIDIEEENKSLKRKAAEFEKELLKKSRIADNKKTINDDRISLEIEFKNKEFDKELKRLTLEKEKEIRELKLEQEREMRKLIKDQIRESRHENRRRELEERDRMKLELSEERESKRKSEIEVEKLRQSKDILYQKMFDMQEDKYQDVRADSKTYHDKLLEVTNKIIEKLN